MPPRPLRHRCNPRRPPPPGSSFHTPSLSPPLARSPSLPLSLSLRPITPCHFASASPAPAAASPRNAFPTNASPRNASPATTANSTSCSTTSPSPDSPASTTPTTSLPRMLTIAGSDSGAGAGIQADMKAAAALGVWCSTVVSALTAQNSKGVQGVLPTPADFVRLQILSILSDIGADAVKTGMLPNGDVILAVCQCLRQLAPSVPLVVDPVLVATSGDSLSSDSCVLALRQDLFPLATLVTPNLREAEVLLEVPAGSIRDVADMRSAATQLARLGSKAVLVKGGHLPVAGPAVDVFFDGSAFHELSAPRVETDNTHGTGCTLASAIAAELAKGQPLGASVKAAKDYLSSVLRTSTGLRLGAAQGRQGPLAHLPSLLPLPHLGAPTPIGAAPAAEGEGQWERGAVGEQGPVAGEAREAVFDPYKYLRLYAVTDSRMNKRWGRTLADAVRGAVRGGATIIQVREKEMDTGDMIKEVSAALAVTKEFGVPLVVNDRVDVALACGADGVHVGQSDMPAELARRILGPNKIIGVSTKTIEQAVKAARDGADYVGVGGVFPTTTKENNKTIGIAGLIEVCGESPIPAVAIGGISGANVASVLVLDRPLALAGVAVVSAIFNQEDVELATSKLSASIADRS